MSLKNITVIGGGTMGNGIAHTFALYNYKTTLIDVTEDIIQRAKNTIVKNLERQVKKEVISEDKKAETLNNLEFVVGAENISPDTDLVIEAIVENKEAKIALYNKIYKLVKQDCIISSNTSSISITELSSAVNPERFIGMHFMNPVPIMKLVEIIRGYSTSDDAYSLIKETALSLDKTPVEVFDYPGFISNRILMPMINEAIFALYEGVADKEAIDTVMKLGMNHPMGPLTLADFIGLDVCLAIMNVLYDGFNDSKYRPCPLLKKMVAANKLGRKTGEGFFKYE